MIDLDQMTETDWNWAYDYNAYRDEEIKALTISKANREAGNPFEYQTADWYRFEQGMADYRSIVNRVREDWNLLEKISEGPGPIYYQDGDPRFGEANDGKGDAISRKTHEHGVGGLDFLKPDHR